MAPPLLILCPPRSYSSVVCAMIGRHPELYGFPELLLFLGETVEEMLRFCQQRHAGGEMFNPRPPGLLRALAQINAQQQSSATIEQAYQWLLARKDWHVKQVFDHLLAGVAPRLGVEKSPWLATDRGLLERLHRAYPDARYLHLTRHPVTAQSSMHEFYQKLTPWKLPGLEGLELHEYCARAWHVWHRNVLAFTSGLPAAQTLRVRGEDLLDDPDTHLPRLTSWLAIRGDADCIEAMKHPEDSPYAGFGPNGAKLSGFDPKFQADPKLRPSKPRPAGLELPAEWTVADDTRTRVKQLARELGYASG